MNSPTIPSLHGPVEAFAQTEAITFGNENGRRWFHEQKYVGLQGRVEISVANVHTVERPVHLRGNGYDQSVGDCRCDRGMRVNEVLAFYLQESFPTIPAFELFDPWRVATIRFHSKDEFAGKLQRPRGKWFEFPNFMVK